MEATIQQKEKRVRQHLNQRDHIVLTPDLLLELYELLQGDRDMVKVYSKALESEICFVNPARLTPDQLDTVSPVYTTRELAYVISLSEEDFRRFHYLKMQLVG